MILGHDIFATTKFANTENGIKQTVRWVEVCPQVTVWTEIPKNPIGVTKCLKPGS